MADLSPVMLEDLSLTAEYRAAVYSLLAHCFYKEPDAELVEVLRGEELRGALEEAGVIFDAVFDVKGTEPLRTLRDEFTRLFIGPGEHVPPYESVFTGEKHFIGGFGRMYGEAAAAVEETYMRHGWNAGDSVAGAPDHLAAELKFMNLLIKEEIRCRLENDDRLQSILNEQLSFVRDHLANWVPSFCRHLSNFSRLEFYGGLSKLTEDFILSEMTYLSSSF